MNFHNCSAVELGTLYSSEFFNTLSTKGLSLIHIFSEIADMTGFSTLSHFSKSFKKQFGVSPSEYGK